MNIDSNKRKIKAKPDYSFIIASGVLFLIGIITLLSASAPKALAESGNSYYYFTRQLFFGVIGIIGAIVVYNIDYKNFNFSLYFNGCCIDHGSIYRKRNKRSC